jgi:hypothetical protein
VTGGPDGPFDPFEPPSNEDDGAGGDAMLDWPGTQPEMTAAIAITAIALAAIGRAVAWAPGRRF